MDRKMEDKMDVNELVDLVLKEIKEDKILEEKQNKIINRNKRLQVKTEVISEVLTNNVGKVKNYLRFNEKFPENTFNRPFTWNFSTKADRVSLINEVDKEKTYSKFNAKSLDLDLIDSFLSSYETKIDSINSRLEKLKAKLLYKPKKIYNLKKKIKKLKILPTIYEETKLDLKSNSMKSYIKTTPKKLSQSKSFERKIPHCKLVENDFFVKRSMDSNLQLVEKNIDSVLEKYEIDIILNSNKSDIIDKKPEVNNDKKIISSVEVQESYNCKRGDLEKKELKEDLLSYAKKDNIKDSDKMCFNKGDSKALFFSDKEQEKDSLKVKCEEFHKKSEKFDCYQNFSLLKRNNLDSNNSLLSSETAMTKLQQIAQSNNKSLDFETNHRYALKLNDAEFDCCNSEVNTESCDKKQPSCLDKFLNSTSTSSFSEDCSNVRTTIPEKIDSFDVWESLHSILSSRSETHLVPSFKRHTKNKKNYQAKPESLLKNSERITVKHDSKIIESFKSKSEDLLNNSKGNNIKDLEKNCIDKGDCIQAKCSSIKGSKTNSLNMKSRKVFENSEEFFYKRNLSPAKKRFLTLNTNLTCIETKNNSKYQKLKSKALNLEVKHKNTTNLTKFDCCLSEVNTKSCNKEQSSYFDMFENYASTSVTSTNFLNDKNNFLTNTYDKINDIDTWESLHSILSSSSETHSASSYKKVTKSKNKTPKYFKFLRSNRISPTFEKQKEENKPKVRKLVSNTGKRLRNSIKNLKRNFVKSFSCFPQL